MINAKFYKEDIEKNIKKLCDSNARRQMLKEYGETCSASINCADCNIMFNFWLLQEYKEPEIDWEKVAVDTPVLVRNFETQEWKNRYFAGVEKGRKLTFDDGKTSFSASDNRNSYEVWKEMKLWEGSKEQAEYIEAEGKRVAALLTK